MKKRAILYFSVILFLMCSRTVSNGSNLDDGLIEKIRSDFQMDTHTRAIYNAITNTDIKTLAINRDLLREHNEFFSNKIKVKGISDQAKSGRCWLFATLNSIRQHTIKKKQT